VVDERDANICTEHLVSAPVRTNWSDGVAGVRPSDADDDSIYRAYFENTAEALFIVDVTPDRSFVFRQLNPIHERLTGLSSAALRGRRPQECLPADIAYAVEANYRRCVEAGATIRYEERLDLPAGARHWQTTLTPMKDASDRIFRILGSSRDITEQTHRSEELEESQDRLRSVLGSITECYCTLDRDYQITAINAAAARWLGAPQEDIVGRSYWALVSPSSPCGQAVLQATAEQRHVSLELQSSVRRDRWLEYNIYPAASGLSIYFRDVTDRVVARKLVENAAALLQGTIDALPARVAVLDDAGVVTAVNSAWKAFTAEGQYCKVGENYLNHCVRAGAATRDGSIIARRLRQLRAGRTNDVRHCYPWTIGGDTRWFQMRASRFEVGGAFKIVVAHEDVTEVRHADDERRAFGSQLLCTLEEERRRIARELHDSTAQHLTAVGLQLTRLRQMNDGREIDSCVSEAREALLEAQREIRTFSYLLHPPVTDSESLISATNRLLEGFELRTGLTAKLRHFDDPLPALSSDRGAALFRVLQEALANVHKHAGARTVSVCLRHRGGSLLVEVEDDGAGIDIVDWEPGSHAHIVFGVGIPGMRARMKQFDGDLTIRRGRKGTIVRAWLPVRNGP
jgi:two-component system NarL family sensor kinase